MDEIRKYILSVIIAAIVSGILINLTGKNNTRNTIIKLLSGIYLSIAVISPLIQLDVSSAGNWMNFVNSDGELIAQRGKEEADEAIAHIIKTQTEAYILEKATTLNASLEVSVTLCDSSPAVPCEVTLCGDISPYAKKVLQNQISNELGISKENQIWTPKR